MKFYLTTDHHAKCFYIATYGKAERPYLIEFKKRFEADQVLKRLNAGLLKGPLENGQAFKLDRVEKDLIIEGSVEVYTYSKK